jgi:serine/threonine protein kinase
MSMIGKTLVHYEISAQIGRGGMGEVYQAKDTKLGRDVAIKVLPEEFALDKDRVARFQREAKLLASLNHPNIAAIHGLEESEGIHFLVMELIEGDTLKDRIKTGPIPVEEALKLALQMAEALEAAHEKGVIHRDLKPANIKVTPEGKVKILDFGLAKAYIGDQSNINLADSPTISAAATQQGVILGTAAYMSPEQARGKPVDRRADIWAFGCVLFEMLTAQAAFQGEDVTEVLAAVVKSEVNLDLLPKNIHPRVREVLIRSLQKEQKKRYPEISQVQYEIEQVLADPSGIFVQPSLITKPKKKLRVGIPVVGAIAILCLIVAGVAIWYLKPAPPPEPKRVIRLNHELPPDQEFTNIGRSVVAISPDGMNIVYVANRQLYLRNLNELTARPIQGTEVNPTTPFFSPNVKWVGFWSGVDSQLKKITVSGGAPVTLCDATNPYGVTWGDDDTILFGQETGIMRVSANGGPAELLIKKEANEYIYGPQILPNRKWVMFAFAEPDATSWDQAQIVVQSLESGERKVLISGGSDARYVPTGHLVYALGGVLYAVAFDADSLEVIGGAVPVVEGVQRAYAETTGTANYGFSDNGMLAYVVGRADPTLPPRKLVWVDREGKEELLSAKSNTFQFPKLSPDGSKVALVIPDGNNQDIWIWDIVRETMTRLTFFELQDIQPIWTPDGNRIVFFSTREEGGIYWKNADGTGEVEFFSSVPDRFPFPWCFSKDGSTLITGELILPDRMDIGMLSMEGDHEHILLLTEEYVEMQPKISPDGRWMAYTAMESDNWGVYVRPFPDVNKGKWQVSTGIGIGPLWSPDGKELFYRSPDGIMAVPVDTEPTFKLGKPKVLFPDTYISLLRGGNEGHAWDIHPDGKRFLMMKLAALESTDEISRPNIIIVQNWFEELKERVPVD